MSNTTSIHELPTDPAGGGSIEGNIGIVTNDIPQRDNNMTLEESTIHQIINGIQQASATGATNLPSRDIPTSTTQITQDPYIQPNYIPTPSTNKYIDESITNSDIIQTYNNNYEKEDSLDKLYNQIQIPLLLAILYFIFQLPIVKNKLFKYMPILFNSDGNINLTGLIITSIMFGTTYMTLSKTMAMISSI
jgi:hypothetical protein